MNHTDTQIAELARVGRTAQRDLALLAPAAKNRALVGIAQGLREASETILDANRRDYDREQAGGMNQGLLDRLLLTEDRLEAIACAVEDVAGLPDPVGQVVDGSVNDVGLEIRRVRVPMGVVGMIYEARPNVTVDAAVLSLKSGNAVLLRGGSAALETNTALVAVMQQALAAQGLDGALVQSIDDLGRPGVAALLRARGHVDVVIPRGGQGLINTVVQQAQVPVIETGTGNVHIYVDRAAKLDDAVEIVVNAKTQRVGVCNAAESLLVHREVADQFIPAVAARLRGAGVEIRGDERARAIESDVVAVSSEDWDTEFLDCTIALGVVDGVDQAIAHIQRYSTGHTEVILTEDLQVAQEFVSRVDAAVVMVNASSRFTDGGVFGLGAEIGISTQKLHARGPMGLADLTTLKWIVYGQGHTRG